jgi:hypothetical protein
MIAFPDRFGSPESGEAAGAPPTVPIPANDEELGDEIARLAAHIHAATYRLLVLIKAMDERIDMTWGVRSTAHWLSWRTGISPGTAREKVRVARALPQLPLISAAMARGEMSFSKVRALTRVATPENEAALLDVARHAPAAKLEKLVRCWLSIDRLEDKGWEERRHESRFLHLYPDDDGSYVIRGRLDPETGALLEKALEWAEEAQYREERGEGDRIAGAGLASELRTGQTTETPIHQATRPAFAQRRADALGLVAEQAFAAADVGEDASAEDVDRIQDGRPGGPDGKEPKPNRRKMPNSRTDRFQVVVHVEATHLLGGTRRGIKKENLPKENVPAGTSEREFGPVHPHIATRSGPLPISIETVRRLASDAGIVLMAHHEEGGVLDVGRKRRTIPPAIRRALEYRDQGCRFPGCGCRHTEGHHIVHWEDGGETKLDNLVSLCQRHHREMHEGGSRVEVVRGVGLSGQATPHFRFIDPHGRVIREAAPAPPIPADPVAALVQAHAEAGIEPDEWTATPHWHGEALDHALAIDMLWRPPGSE